MENFFKKVLIVDDDLALKPIWHYIFETLSDSTEIDWVVSCEQAVNLIQMNEKNSSRYDLLVIDIFLAGSFTGLDFIESEIIKRKKIKTILTSSISEEKLDSILKQDFENILFVSKPINISQVLQNLSQLLKGDCDESHLLK